MGKFGIIFFGKRDGFEIFGDFGGVRQYIGPDAMLFLAKYLQLDIENGFELQNKEEVLFSFSGFQLHNQPVQALSIYRYAKDSSGRAGYFGTSILINDLQIEPSHAAKLLIEYSTLFYPFFIDQETSFIPKDIIPSINFSQEELPSPDQPIKILRGKTVSFSDFFQEIIIEEYDDLRELLPLLIKHSYQQRIYSKIYLSNIPQFNSRIKSPLIESSSYQKLQINAQSKKFNPSPITIKVLLKKNPFSLAKEGSQLSQNLLPLPEDHPLKEQVQLLIKENKTMHNQMGTLQKEVEQLKFNFQRLEQKLIAMEHQRNLEASRNRINQSQESNSPNRRFSFPQMILVFLSAMILGMLANNAFVNLPQKEKTKTSQEKPNATPGVNSKGSGTAKYDQKLITDYVTFDLRTHQKVLNELQKIDRRTSARAFHDTYKTPVDKLEIGELNRINNLFEEKRANPATLSYVSINQNLLIAEALWLNRNEVLNEEDVIKKISQNGRDLLNKKQGLGQTMGQNGFTRMYIEILPGDSLTDILAILKREHPSTSNLILKWSLLRLNGAKIENEIITTYDHPLKYFAYTES